MERGSWRVSQDIIDAVVADRKDGASLTDLCEKYPVSKGKLSMIIKNVPRGKFTPKVREVKDHETTIDKRPDLSKTDLGAAAQELVSGKLAIRAFDVYKPIKTSTPVDLLIVANGQSLRCQCKVLFQDEEGRHVFQFSTHTTNSHHGGKSKPRRRYYTADDIDFFLHVRAETEDVYVIPIADVAGHSQTSAWISSNLKTRRGPTCWLDHEKYKNAWNLLRA